MNAPERDGTTNSILGIGTAVPEHVLSQADAVALAEALGGLDDRNLRLLKVLYRKAGVTNRYTCVPYESAFRWTTLKDAPRRSEEDGSLLVAAEPTHGPTTQERMELYQEHAWPLALRASAEALAVSEIPPSEITHLVTVSCTGFHAPGVDVHLIRTLGLSPTTERVHVGFMGCHGALNALRVCQGLTAVTPGARILLCAVELCSLHYRYQWDPERFLGNAFFGDGAAALVVGSPHEGGSAGWRLAGTGSCLIPDSLEAIGWQIGDHGFEMSLSAEVPSLIERHLRAWLSAWLERHGTSIDRIGCWAVHPGGPRILSAVEQSLGLPRVALSHSREVLAEMGNMSSPTVVFILQRLLARGAAGPCVMLGFGPGLTAEAVLLLQQ